MAHRAFSVGDMDSEEQKKEPPIIEFCPSSDDDDDPTADTPPEAAAESDPIRQEWMRAVDTAKHGLRTERMGLGCTLEMIRDMRKDANMRSKLRAKLTGKRRNEEGSDDDDEEKLELKRTKDDSDDEGRAALGSKSTKASPTTDVASSEVDSMVAGLTKSQKKRLKKKQKLQRNAEAFNRLKNADRWTMSHLGPPPYDISSNGRYYINQLPEVALESDLADGLSSLIKVVRQHMLGRHRDTDLGAVYVGELGGGLLLEAALERYHLTGLRQYDWRAAIQQPSVPSLSSRRVSLLEGPGVAHRSLLVLAGDHGAPLRELLDFSRVVRELPASECELLYGRAGYLSSLLWINKHAELREADRREIGVVCRDIVRAVVDAESHWQGDHYQWTWHHKPYLGAAHGTAGSGSGSAVVYNPEGASELLARLLATASWVLEHCRCRNVNIESSVGSRSGGNLVHWCHGATGWIPALVQLAGAVSLLKPEGYEGVLVRIKDTICSLGEVVYERGLLAEKGAGLCHGVGGSTMALVAVYTYTGHRVWLHRARQFALFTSQYGQWLSDTFADRPYSLYEGLAGAVASIGATLAAAADRGQNHQCMRLHPQEVFFHGTGSKPEYVFTIDFWHRPLTEPPEDQSSDGQQQAEDVASSSTTSDDIICATGGADTVVRLWRVGKRTAEKSPPAREGSGSPTASTGSQDREGMGCVSGAGTVGPAVPALELHAELSGSHSHGCVTCVRFAPPVPGEQPVLASAGDDGHVVFWVYTESPLTGEMQWVAQPRALNCLDEVSGIAWSPNGRQLAVCLHRELCVVWDVATAKQIQRLDGHTSRVLGVAWDPRDRYICTTSADRTCRIWARNKRKSFYPKAVVRTYDAQVIAKETVSAGEAGADDSVAASLAEKTVREKIFINDSHYAHDATAHFFRRPSFSPDGRLLLVPGCLTPHGDYGCLVLARGDGFSNPAAIINSGSTSPTVCTRFFPLPVRPPGSDENPLHYVFTIGTAAAQIALYDTTVFNKGRRLPRAAGSDLHCTSIVDLAFDDTGRFLAVAGSDGYVTLCELDQVDLGGSPCKAEEVQQKAGPPAQQQLYMPLINNDKAATDAMKQPQPVVITADARPVPSPKIHSPMVQTVFAEAADFVRSEAANLMTSPSSGGLKPSPAAFMCSPAKRSSILFKPPPPSPGKVAMAKKSRRKITPTLVRTPTKVVDASTALKTSKANVKSPALELVRIDLDAGAREALEKLRRSLPSPTKARDSGGGGGGAKVELQG
ncbi:Chromatin assembly factor 1 subunit B [Perkinsus chesapeaki]|uniref:Chromatin assembly factor 1 subunit B n=1 Tax=Perkinsus chesapeaki TaxID=330153 RepID=A0A7J6LXZ9_PERCH|nr:Chromatin assembly factor 1 subunit B [Perkinsus chesapeaki]